MLAAVCEVAGVVEIDLMPLEVSWTVSLGEDDQQARYDCGQVGGCFAAAIQVVMVLAAFRVPSRGRSTPVNGWWGSFDLAVSLFSGSSADPLSDDFVMRNAMDAQEVAVGWWPGEERYGTAAFYGYAHPAPEGVARMTAVPAGGCGDDVRGEYILDWDEVVVNPDPRGTVLEFARSVFRHACAVGGWDPGLAVSADGTPPPRR